MISLKPINRQKVKKIPIPNEDTRPIKGSDICPEVYANIFLCARKNCGKTCTVFKIMKECVGRHTVIILFCSTAYKDKNWIQIRKYFENKGLELRVYTSIFDDGEDQLFNLIDDLKQEAKEDEEKKNAEPEPKKEIDNCDYLLSRLKNMDLPEEEKEAKETKPRKCKYRAPEYMIIFDDLSSELKSKSLLSLLKFNRHFKSKLIISSQWPHDLLPESRKQIDLFIIFKGFPDAKLEHIHTDCDTRIDFETFSRLYKKATEKDYSFLYIDTRADEFRRNFNKKFILKTDV